MVLDYSSGKIIAKLDRSTKTLVDGVSFSVDEGKTLAIIGETGAGKTIVANSITSILSKNVSARYSSIEFLGEKFENGKKLSRFLGDKIVYIPQSGKDCLNPTRTIGSQIADGLKKLGVKRKDIPSVVQDRLRLVGLDETIANLYPSALSGGMAGKVVVAMAMSPNARLVVADEPTSGMDEKSKQECLCLIKTLFPNSATILITHDLSVAKTADDILVLANGKAVEYGTAEKVLSGPHHPYVRALLSSLPENGLTAHPKLRSGESECPFFERCKYASADCNGEIQVKKVDGVEVRCVL